MSLEILTKTFVIIDLFCSLVAIPSPSLKEDNLIGKILDICKANNLPAKCDDYGNIIIKVPATDISKKPILLSAHMDVVGDDTPVNIVLKGDIIETDKKRTLGADDKAGVAAAIMLAIEVSKDKSLKHGGLEIVLTRDEETGMTGIKHVNMKNLNSEYVLVLDADKMGQVLVSGASFTKLTLNVETFIGGHSGIDIGDEKRLNAVKLLCELGAEIPQGAYKKDEYGVLTSINAGAIAGGAIKPAIDKIAQGAKVGDDVQDFIIENSITNIINKNAAILYSVRSNDSKAEKELISLIENIVCKFNKKYEGLAKADLKKEIHVLPFEKSDDETIINVAKKAAKDVDIEPQISSFHAAAETHIYANNVNKSGKKFKPVLIGVADVYNMHSPDEKMDYKSYLKGYDFLKAMFVEFNK